jgi:hypothetical protein
MPYYEKGNLLLIHIPKTGGTSVNKYLYKRYKAKKCAKTLYNYHKNDPIKHPLQHATLDEIIKYKSDIVDINTVRIITIVRNPYHRVISALFWSKKIDKNSTLEQIEAQIDIFLKIDADIYTHNWPQYKFIELENGVILPQIVIMKTESLNTDMHTYGYKNFNSNDNVTFRDKLDYNLLLTDSAKDKIYQFYKRDFELFGYDKDIL